MSDVEGGVDAEVDEVEVDDVDGADEVEDDAVADEVSGGTAKAVLTYLAENIVEDHDSIEIAVEDGRRGVTLRLHVAPDDMGKIIGRRGRVAQAIRTIVRAAGEKDGIDAQVDIVD